MPITHLVSPLLNLSQYQVWIVDNNPTSTYFQLTQLPDTLTSGKNAFLINGSPQLVNTTNVLIEVLDGAGVPIFCQPVENYTEGLARVVEIDVYQTTTPGLGSITILGHLAQDINGNLPPANFASSYNVKWSTPIQVLPQAGNTTQIRLYNHPTASVTEILNPFRQISQSLATSQGDGIMTIQGVSNYSFDNSGNPFPGTYLAITSEAFFNKQMEGGTLIIEINNTPFTTNISQVINNNLGIINPGYEVNSQFLTFNSTNFTASYTGSPSFIQTQSTQSYADVTISGLTSFTGNVSRIKVFLSGSDQSKAQELLTDTNITPIEFLETSSLTLGLQKLRTGYFTDQSIPTNYWIIGEQFSSSLYNPG